MLSDAPFLYTVLRTDRERVLFMYEHSDRMQNGRPAKWLSVMLYSLQLALLIFSAGRVFSGGDAVCANRETESRSPGSGYSIPAPETELPYLWEEQP